MPKAVVDLPNPEEEVDGRRRRGRLRRELIVRVAAELFRERTYRDVSIEEIGEAAGVTGAAIYRHFRNKDELLVAVLAPVADWLWSSVLPASSDEPLAVLDQFLSRLARSAVDRPDLIALWYQEWRNLPDKERRAARDMMRDTVTRLARLLRQARPELDLASAFVTVDAAMGIAGHVGHPGAPGGLAGDALHARLSALASAAVRA